MAIVEFKDVSRVYVSADHELRALDHVNMTLDEGKFVVILGPSGAGKSTLLNLLDWTARQAGRFLWRDRISPHCRAMRLPLTAHRR